MLELLRQGADPHAASNQKRTPLHEACMQGNFMTLSIIFKSRLEKSHIYSSRTSKFSYWETMLYLQGTFMTLLINFHV